jgi:hypothetical protein
MVSERLWLRWIWTLVGEVGEVVWLESVGGPLLGRHLCQSLRCSPWEPSFWYVSTRGDDISIVRMCGVVAQAGHLEMLLVLMP